MESIKILLAADHPLVRSSLETLLQCFEGLDIVGEAENGQETVEKTGELSPDVAIIDSSMPKLSGIEATKIITKEFPNTRVLALCMHGDEEHVIQVLRCGASGYIVKSSAREELIEAIRAVAKGWDFRSSKFSGRVLETISPHPASARIRLTASRFRSPSGKGKFSDSSRKD